MLAAHLAGNGCSVRHASMFDTVVVDGVDADAVIGAAATQGINLRRVSATAVGVSFDETTTPAVVSTVAEVVAGVAIDPAALGDERGRRSPDRRCGPTRSSRRRCSEKHHNEHAMLRYLRRLADRDLALDRTMIPLGSCTMKLNATTEMEPITWPEFANIHPFAPDDQTEGYRAMIAELEAALCEITGYDAVSLQPNAGSQGEFAGLLAIRAYHRSRGDLDRTTCLIPASAHGTNAASAVMAGMDVVVVRCDDRRQRRPRRPARQGRRGRRSAGGDHGDVPVDARGVRGRHRRAVRDRACRAAARCTSTAPTSTPSSVSPGRDVRCRRQPPQLAQDVLHPARRGRTGSRSGGRARPSRPFLPGDPLGGAEQAVGPVAAARFGSAGILPIPWVYIRHDGRRRVCDAPPRRRSSPPTTSPPGSAAAFPVLYTGEHGRVAHECIIDLRPITKQTGVTVDDVAKRLIDFGFHAPTMSFPVAGTLMIEPTESERPGRARPLLRGDAGDPGRDRRRSPAVTSAIDASALRHAPHTAEDLLADWDRPYTPAEAAFPDRRLGPTSTSRRCRASTAPTATAT